MRCESEGDNSDNSDNHGDVGRPTAAARPLGCELVLTVMRMLRCRLEVGLPRMCCPPGAAASVW